MRETEKTPSERMKEFLDFIDRCHAEYQLAYDAVSGFSGKRVIRTP